MATQDNDGHFGCEDDGFTLFCDVCNQQARSNEIHHCAGAPKTESMGMVIMIDGGLVQGIDGIPSGLSVDVWDYDVEGSDDPKIETDAEGNDFIRSTYQG